MGKLTGYDMNGSTQIPQPHSYPDTALDQCTFRNPGAPLLKILQQPLLQYSSRGMYSMASKSIPPTVLKPGFCDSQISIAAELTQSFLDFASKNGGINLKQLGVRPGQRWCIEATRWQDQLQHEKEAGGEVPPVKLECTHESALKIVDLDVLKKYATALDS